MRVRSLGVGVVVAVLTSGCAFEGLRSTDFAGTPPDVQVAAGIDHVVEVTNNSVRIFLKEPLGEVVSTLSLDSVVGCPNAFDPRIRYDAPAQRWYLVAAERNSVAQTGTVCFAVSTASDPTLGFVNYQFPLSGMWPDFTTLGYSDDKIVLSGNQIEWVPGTGTPGYALWVLDKADLLNGGTVANQFVFLGPNVLFIPATSLSSINTLYMAGMGSGLLRVFTVTGVPGVGSGVQVTFQDLGFTYNPTPPNAQQKGTLDVLLTTGGTREAVYRDGSLWVGATSACIPSGDTSLRACLRIVELRQSAGVFSIFQDIELASAGKWYFFPALTVDADGALIVGFGSSSLTTYPTFLATGRRVTDALNTLRTPFLLAAGQAPFGDNDMVADVKRWGDYFGAAIDPVDQRLTWLAGEYAAYPALVYGTRIELVDNQLIM